MNQHSYEAAASVANKVTAGGAGATVFSWVVDSNFGVLAGIVIGVAGLLVNWYYRHKQDRREEAEYLHRVAQRNKEMNL